VIQKISDKKDHVVFMLWGSYAKNKGKVIDTNKHLILNTVHPSPLSVYRGFFGCKHFSKANEYLVKNGKTAIEW
jgi:uracil-DNA glycosylase